MIAVLYISVFQLWELRDDFCELVGSLGGCHCSVALPVADKLWTSYLWWQALCDEYLNWCLQSLNLETILLSVGRF